MCVCVCIHNKLSNDVLYVTIATLKCIKGLVSVLGCEWHEKIISHQKRNRALMRVM